MEVNLRAPMGHETGPGKLQANADSTAAASRLQVALERLEHWLAAHDFQGYDPHDALNSPLLGTLARGNRLLGIAFVQLLRRSPLNLRPLLGVRPGRNPKGMGLFLTAYIRRCEQSGGAASDKARVDYFSDWLLNQECPGYHGACWGYNFDWPNRAFLAPRGTPTIVNTVFIANAFLRWSDVLGDARGLETARSACEFILKDLGRFEDSSGFCFSYTPLDRRRVHNANLLGASLLARVGTRTGEPQLVEAARAALAYSMARQAPDGSWPYGDAANETWIDNFHTGFNLVALADFIDCTGSDSLEPALQRGYAFWKDNFFLPDGAPKFYSGAAYPIDIHCVAQAIVTFLRFAERDPAARQQAFRVALWGIEHMQDAAGFFHYQIHRLYRVRTPFIRWSQAWMFYALTECWAAAGGAGTASFEAGL